MIGIIQRFGMATELSHRKKTVHLLYHQKKTFGISVMLTVPSLFTSLRMYEHRLLQAASVRPATEIVTAWLSS
jgi:hypothetical protein